MKLGKSSIAELVAQIKEEKAQSRDFIVPTQELHITEEEHPVLVMRNKGAIETFNINENAHRQMAGRLGSVQILRTYAYRLPEVVSGECKWLV